MPSCKAFISNSRDLRKDCKSSSPFFKAPSGELVKIDRASYLTRLKFRPLLGLVRLLAEESGAPLRFLIPVLLAELDPEFGVLGGIVY